MTIPSCDMVILSFLCSVFQYTFALLLIFLLEAMVGIMSFLYEPHVADELSVNLNKTFIDNYKVDDGKTRAIDQMQIEVVFREGIEHIAAVNEFLWLDQLHVSFGL